MDSIYPNTHKHSRSRSGKMERSSIGFFRTTMVRMMVQILMDGEEKDEKVINPKKVKTMILNVRMTHIFFSYPDADEDGEEKGMATKVQSRLSIETLMIKSFMAASSHGSCFIIRLKRS